MAPTVQKAKIYKLKYNGDSMGSRDCMYNPESLVISRSAQWTGETVTQKDRLELTYSGAGVGSFEVKLWFDTTLEQSNKPGGSPDVREKLAFLFKLMDVDEAASAPGKKEPPRCRFEWGGAKHVIIGVVTSVSADYKLFNSSGLPVRALVTVKIQEEMREPHLTNKGQNPTSRSEARKTWIVREGDRLDWIAYQEYGNSAHWRHIAETNNLDDPFSLRTGQVLKLTPLD